MQIQISGHSDFFSFNHQIYPHSEQLFVRHNESLIKFKHITGGLIRNMRKENCEWKNLRYQGVIYTTMFRKRFLYLDLLKK